MFKYILLALFVSGISFAETNSTELTVNTNYSDDLVLTPEAAVAPLNWEAEAHYQTLSVSPLQLFGPSLHYKSNKNRFGVRMLAPTQNHSELNLVSLQAIWRRLLSERTTKFFTEATASINFFNTTYGYDNNKRSYFTAAGMNIGALYQFNSDFSVGGISGFEIGGNLTKSDFGGYGTENSPFISPRLAFFGQLSF